MIIWVFVVLSQYNRFDVFYGIYRRWKKSEDETEKEALGVITLKDVYKLENLKKERKEHVISGKIVSGFTVVARGSLGCVFYSAEKTHTYVYVVIVDPNHLITIPLMFSSPIYPKSSRIDEPKIKKLFSQWANDNEIKIEHLLFYDRGRSYDPEGT